MRYKNPLSELTPQETAIKFNKDIENGGAFVHTWDGKKLNLENCQLAKIEFIGGLWRFQKEFNHEIKKVRDKEFVLGGKINKSQLPKEEIPIFNYYTAAMVNLNCYGYILDEFNYIVANCGNAWSYGKSISDTRAYLSSKVIDISLQNPKICKIILTEMKKNKSR